jgi:opacity protein-like surface antigen
MVLRRSLGLTAVAFAACVAESAAQASFTPAYNAPYRAFESHEFGGGVSFPAGDTDFAVEGQYRFGKGRFDIGVKVGIADGVDDTRGVAGVEARFRVVDHTERNFPLDGAVVLGVGTYGLDRWVHPSAGISLGRRVDLDGFEFVAYGQPTVFLTTASADASGNDETRLDFGLGLGLDFEIADAVDLRTSFGVADGPRGVSFGVVWVR